MDVAGICEDGVFDVRWLYLWDQNLNSMYSRDGVIARLPYIQQEYIGHEGTWTTVQMAFLQPGVVCKRASAINRMA